MAPVLEQVSGHGPDRVRPEAASLVRGVEEQVDRGMAVIGAGLLEVLDAPDKDSVDLDGEPDALVRLEPLIDRVIGAPGSPPRGNPRLGQDVAKGVPVRGTMGPKRHPFAAQLNHQLVPGASSNGLRGGYPLEGTSRSDDDRMNIR